MASFQLVDVADFGALGDGVTDDTPAINAAFSELDSTAGGELYFPSGDYLTTGLDLSGKPVSVRGDGPSGWWSWTNTVTRILSTSNAPILKLGGLPGQHSLVKSLAIVGNNTGTSQHGLVIDNRGSHVRDVVVDSCGGDGIVIADCVSGSFLDVASNRNTGHGWVLDPDRATDANSATTASTFANCTALSNGGDGWHFDSPTSKGNWGCTWLACVSEKNTGYGVLMTDSGGSVRFHRFYGLWLELNVAGTIRFNSANVTDNTIEVARMDGEASHNNAHSRNLVGGPQMNLSPAGIASSTHKQIRTGGGYGSSDVDSLVIRDREDTYDGNVRLQSLITTYGLSAGVAESLNTLEVPQASDAVCVPHSKGITSRNEANDGNVALLSCSDDDSVKLGGVRWHSGNGVPGASLDGDMYVRLDGAAGTWLYAKIAGTWTAIA